MAVNVPKTAPFPIDATLTGIAIAYRNTNLIADMVLPRVQVATKEFKWTRYDKDERFTVPNTLVGRKGRPTEVDFGATEDTSQTHDYGLDDIVPNDDIIQAAAAGNGYNPLGHATEALTDLILLDREVRTAGVIFSASSYVTGQKETLSGTDLWSDYDNSTPKEQLLDALDVPLMRPNVLTLGQSVWTKLRQHPQLVSSILRNDGRSGTITRQQLADLLEIEEVIVGQGFVNIAKPGQAASMQRVWGNHASLMHRNRLANTQRGVTFGFTAQYQGRIAGQMPDPVNGLRGAVRVRAGESVKELVVAPELGYFFENVI
jgi:hypothetical protein